ncbi:hypothetical protein F0562_026131 [Nyssa sinensis]|uniref:Delta(3)-Delta(2)-enoyl-CoA isomerase n=1 Tax=Nyssa sinensis TaxID=561372 RepID=A0A5J5B9Y4_9ASTE|nr:hypothetical protein F0562_026131 [Nyssa sinensis]
MSLDRSRSPPRAKRYRSSERASYRDAPYQRDRRTYQQDYLCNKCKRPGHFARACPNVTVCNNCGLPGHIAAECTLTTMCWNCKEPGHLASQCNNDPVCHMCGKMGHLARDCFNPSIPPHDARLCNNCYKPGHFAADCTNEKACNNCHKTGHLARDCPNDPVCNICNISGHVARQCLKSGLPPPEILLSSATTAVGGATKLTSALLSRCLTMTFIERKEMCTLEKRGSLFILKLTGDDEHRLNPTLIDAIKAALHQIRSESSTTPSALITTAHGKFFSNGYDLAWAKTSGHAATTPNRLLHMSSKFRSLINDLISLPVPTIAAVSGHASAAGFILALCHDYVLMRKDRGFLYMSEVDIGLKMPAWFMPVLRCKIGSPTAWRDVVLRAEKLTAEVAVEKGIIDSAHASVEETMKAALRLGEELVSRKWDGHVYAQNRKVVLADVLGAIDLDETVENASLVASRL